MQLSQEQNPLNHTIRAYEPGRLTVDLTCYIAPVILGPEEVHPWQVESATAMQTVSIEALLQWPSDVILIGTGEQHQSLAPACLQPLIERGIGFEIMSTRSACHTYLILAAEGRAVVAGLIP